jgi:uncharacterized protein
VDLTLIQMLCIAVLVFLGAVVQGTIGFGLAIVAAPFLILIHPELVPGPVLFFGMASAAFNVWANRVGLAFRELTLALVARVPGTLLAMVVLVVASPSVLSVLLGLSVLAAVVLSVRTPYVERTSRVMFTAGFMSGFMGTTTAIGGPPIALAYQSATGPEARANLGGYLLIGMVASLFALTLIGRFTAEHLTISLIMLVPVMLGVYLARILTPMINPAWLRPALLVLCSISGAVALLKGGLGLLPWFGG